MFIAQNAALAARMMQKQIKSSLFVLEIFEIEGIFLSKLNYCCAANGKVQRKDEIRPDFDFDCDEKIMQWVPKFYLHRAALVVLSLV